VNQNSLSVGVDARARRFAIPAPEHAPAIKDKWFPPLDGLRGLAILLVMLFHYDSGLNRHDAVQHILGSLLDFGWTGVDLFFVLSGFLITGILLDTRSASNYYSAFYARRGLRIFPLYYLSLPLIFSLSPPTAPLASIG